MKERTLFKKNYNLFLKQQMMASGLSLRELSKKTGYSYEGVRQALGGRGSYRNVFEICRALNVDFKQLLIENILC